MSVIRPFRALRPAPGKADQIASLPYDVMNRSEAQAMAEGKPLSFLNVVRAEINFPDNVDMYSDEVYAKGRENLQRLIREGHMVQDDEAHFYIYRQIMDGRVQTGLVACVSVDEYQTGKIKKHELTRAAKEVDRIKHFGTCNANTAPIFLTYRHIERVDEIMHEYIKRHKPVFNFTTEDHIMHVGWVIQDPDLTRELILEFAELDALYIADGHHRSASAAKVGEQRRAEFPDRGPEAEFNYFMAVLFADRDLYVMDYNRVVRDLNGRSKEQFLTEIMEKFSVKKYEAGLDLEQIRPSEKANYSMYLDGEWYALEAKPELLAQADPVDRLDVSILQQNLLAPILGIGDPRVDERIDFVGGIRGLEELERRVDSGEMQVAFALFPTAMDELLGIADAGEIMPPKSTWFEPKLRSGLFVHSLDD